MDLLRFPARVLGTALATGLVMGLLFRYRTDYLGHYIAGFGATLCALALLSNWVNGWTLLPLTLLAISVGVVTESTVFLLAIFDPVDFFNQSLGAAVAGCVMVRAPRPWRIQTTSIVLLMGMICVYAGFRFAFA